MKSRDNLRIVLLGCLLVLVSGCRGCNSTTPTDPPKDAAEARKNQRVISDRTATIPSESGIVVSYVKPGHWYQANTRLTANQQDESLTISLSPVDRLGKEVPMNSGTAPIRYQRSVSLAKGQQKSVSLMYLQPDVALGSFEEEMDFSKETTPALLRIQYSAKGFGTPMLQESNPLRLLYGYQYCLVTLCRDPARYSFLRALDCTTWSSHIKAPDERITPHRILDIKEDDIATQFPSRFYAMTSMSHLMINDGSPALLNLDQQQAVTDWLHFGGTIIINGIDGLDRIEPSFLREYSPLVNTSTSTWSEEDSNLLNNAWTIKRIDDAAPIAFTPARSFPKLNGKLAEGARWMESLEGLVAEKIVGQGRIVMTTFPMNEPSFMRWPSYSSLIHNAILRMPSRTISKPDTEAPPPANPGSNAQLNATPDMELSPTLDTTYAGKYQGSELNPLHSTRLRIWARDLDSSTNFKRAKEKATKEQPDDSAASSEFPAGKKTGLGGWNSESDVLASAKESLQESSGITVPKIKTIVWLLTGYLVVLVPINWAVFRLAGKVEFAWVMAPIIAVIGAFVVARSVQLDVGFSRSQTSYGFLECHAGYQRGNLSSYLALYTSLTTNYQALFPDDKGIVSPLPQSFEDSSSRRRLSIDGYDYTFASDDGVGLIKTPVLSNTTGLIYAEEMYDLQGSFNVDIDLANSKLTLYNGSAISLRDIGILGIGDDNKLISSWVGDINPDQETECDIKLTNNSEKWHNNWELNPALSKPDTVLDDGRIWTGSELKDDLYLGKLLEIVASKYPLTRGEILAIGWTEENLSKLEVTPQTNQSKHKTLVLIHLKTANLEPIKPDEMIFPAIKIESAE
ncbi:MAG: hypothetical protein MUC83_09840 [Pirellula sp.]|nr:hypothetical protein [Pirellula sp.]